jgi:hypothetical protein
MAGEMRQHIRELASRMTVATDGHEAMVLKFCMLLDKSCGAFGQARPQGAKAAFVQFGLALEWWYLSDGKRGSTLVPNQAHGARQ